MKRLGLAYVHLDITHRPAEFIREHFPTIHAHCLSLGLDITREPIPVVPSAHFTCGGVVTDLSARTDIDGLYAIGEVACTACTAPTAWPATLCSNAWCLRRPQPPICCKGSTRARCRLYCAPGRKPRDEFR